MQNTVNPQIRASFQIRAPSYRPKCKISVSPRKSAPSLPPFYRPEYRDNKLVHSFVEFNHKQVTRVIQALHIDRRMVEKFGLLKPNQRCAAGLDHPKGLSYVVLQERQYPSETSEGLAHRYATKNRCHELRICIELSIDLFN